MLSDVENTQNEKGGCTMKIAIIGSGGMGCLYGSYLARGKDEVWLFDHWEAHIAKIRQDGLSVVAADAEFTVRPRATTYFDEIGPVDLIIIDDQNGSPHRHELL